MGQPQRALPLVAQALDTARRYHLQPLRLTALYELAINARAQGAPARALGYYQQAVAGQDSLLGSQTVSATLQEELEQQWTMAKAEARRYAADQRQQQLCFVGLGVLALALGGAVALLLLFLRQMRRLARQDKQLLTQQGELSRLRAAQLA